MTNLWFLSLCEIRVVKIILESALSTGFYRTVEYNRNLEQMYFCILKKYIPAISFEKDIDKIGHDLLRNSYIV